MSDTRARAALLELAQQLRRRLEVERAHGGLRGLVPAPEEVRQEQRDAHRARAKRSQERAMRALREPAPARPAPAPEPASAPEPARPAPTSSLPATPAEEGIISAPPTTFESPKPRAQTPPPAATAAPPGGALWKQMGSRPVSLFSNTKEPQAPSRNEVPVMKKANDASTPMMFPELETPTAARSAPLAGFDGTDDERTAISELSPQARLDFLRDCLGDCQRCKLSTTRKNIVFGVGNPQADLVFVGEAPGYHEDQQGIPFVGKAGGLLTRMIEAMGLTRDGVYICNTVKCRPPNNRDPEADELAQCSPFLYKQLESLQPQVIVTLGRKATHILLDTTRPMRVLRGQWQDWRGVAVLPTYHPAYLLRNPADKRLVWRDLQIVMERMGLERPSS